MRADRSSGGRLFSLSFFSAISSVVAQTWEECDEESIASFGIRRGAKVEGQVALAIGGCGIRILGTLRGIEEEGCTPKGVGEGSCVGIAVVPGHEL